MYTFLFDKKSLVLLLAGAAVLGGVLFFSGVLIGVQWGLPLPGTPAAAPSPAPRKAAVPAGLRPCRPESVPFAPSPEPAAAPALRAEATPLPEPPEVRPAPAPQSLPVESLAREAQNAQEALARTEPEAAPAPVTAEPMTAEPIMAAPVTAMASTPPAASAGETGGRYSLQVGAFREAKNSEKVIQDLQARGYTPYIVEQRGRSVLQTVRVGRYAGRAEAARAAVDFRRRVGMSAIVRPIDS